MYRTPKIEGPFLGNIAVPYCNMAQQLENGFHVMNSRSFSRLGVLKGHKITVSGTLHAAQSTRLANLRDECSKVSQQTTADCVPAEQIAGSR
jgi:hypothetical protein